MFFNLGMVVDERLLVYIVISFIKLVLTSITVIRSSLQTK